MTTRPHAFACGLHRCTHVYDRTYPALPHFAEQHVNCSLQTANGTLWVGNGFYWLDPGNDAVLAYLKQIARELAEKEKNVRFGGRLGEYRYYDMDKVIASALEAAERELGR